MSTPASLTATYTSPTTIQTFSTALPAQPTATASAEEKTAFIAALRSNTTQMQAEINALLTAKMEEDKAQDAAAAITGAKSAKDEDREEDMYGEEDVGED